MKHSVLLSLFVLCLFSCSSESDNGLLPEVPGTPVVPEVPADVPEPITLYSGIGSISAGQTRGDGIISSTLTAHLPVNVVRIDKAVGDANYPAAYPTTGTPENGIFVDKLQAKIIKENGKISFIEYYDTNDLRHIYRSDKGYTKLIGWYPQTGVWAPATRTVTFPALDGTTDILATATVEGSKVDKFDTRDAKILKFAHVLTQVRVFVYLEDANYQNLWGNLTSIELLGKKQVCTLTLPAANTTIGSRPTAAFTGTADLPLQKLDNTGAVGTTTLPAGKPDETKVDPLGYAMIAPHTAAEKITFRVTTVKGGAQDVDLVLNTPKNFPLEAGKSYNIFLKLYATQIEATATITDWVTAPAGEQPGEIGIG